MKHRIVVGGWLATLLIFCSISFSYGQGCSDAGFCTMGALRPDQAFNRRVQFRLRSVEFSQYLGKTRFKDFVHVSTLEATLGINDANAIHVKLPFQFVQGPLGTHGGLGDLSLSYTRTLVVKDDWQVQASVGTKVPLRQPNLVHESGLPLPMYYQPTLGTVDLIAGVSFISKEWLVATGVQHALNPNSSDFLWAPWEGHPLRDVILTYPQSNQVRRGTDVMLRVQYTLRLGNKYMFVGALPIYRLAEDQIVNPAGDLVSIAGSDGLALTGLLGGGYRFNTRSGIKGLLGMALVQRLKNPDGLSRKYVFSVGYEYRF